LADIQVEYMATGFVYYPDFLEHDTGPSHPERAERLRSVMAHLESSGQLSQVNRLEATACETRWLHSVHTEDHVDLVRRAAGQAPVHLDPDTVVSAGSWDVARLASGSLLAACDAVVDGRVDNAFCASRPPGHHAERDHAMGFCLFNHVAVAARYLQAQHSIDRVMIIDWDVHHGNGTQHIFEDDASVFYFSIHQYPFYPGTGAAGERGKGDGDGATLNIPMTAGNNDDAYIAAFEEQLVPAAEDFAPQFILVSAGFDAHEADPLASMAVTEDGFQRLSTIVADLAAVTCGGHLVSQLEGGYNTDALARSVAVHLDVLLDKGR
jgi:acetoin utilization deacetylase AcuC-like enzyme